MKFGDTFIGNFVAVRRVGTGSEGVLLRLYGKDRILTLSKKRLVMSDGSGGMMEELECDDDDRACVRQSLESFAGSILSPDENRLVSSGRENLKDMAVIESAYLSARTGFPEEPGRILQMAPKSADEATTT
jgi:hypothetical protein